MPKMFRSALSPELAGQPAGAVLPQIHLYDDDNFGGDQLQIFGGGTESLSRSAGKGWNDDVSSVVVVSGTWELFSDEGFAGRRLVLTPGVYSSIEAAGNDAAKAFPAGQGWNDALSSLRAIAW
jgi:hypothetical protein